jgi:hypothetical protein
VDEHPLHRNLPRSPSRSPNGKHVIEGAYSVIPGIGGGIGSYDWGWARPPVNYNGPAVLLGKITCGTHASEAKTKLIFE